MTRNTVHVNLPERPDLSEIWANNGARYINLYAQEGAELRYERGPYNACLQGSDAQARAEEMDTIQQQRLYAFDVNMVKMIRGLFCGFEQSLALFQYGVMVGKKMERERRRRRMRKAGKALHLRAYRKTGMNALEKKITISMLAIKDQDKLEELYRYTKTLRQNA